MFIFHGLGRCCAGGSFPAHSVGCLLARAGHITYYMYTFHIYVDINNRAALSSMYVQGAVGGASETPINCLAFIAAMCSERRRIM